VEGTDVRRRLECSQGTECKPLLVGGEVKGEEEERLWAGWAWEESKGMENTRKKIQLDDAGGGEEEQEEKWADFMTLEAMCVMGAAALGWHTVLSEEGNRKETTALMTPMATGKAFENEEEGERVRGAMQRYAATVGVHQEESTGQWVCFRVQWDKRRRRPEGRSGRKRRKQWRGGSWGREDGRRNG
jgi:hypothetical protein